MKKVLILLLAATLLFSIGFSAERLSVGAKNFTEQYIVGSMISQLLEANEFNTTEDFGMSSFAVRTALTTGQIDLYPDYTGTAWVAYLEQESVLRDPVELYNKVKEMDLEQNGIVWLDMVDINNTYALAVTEEFAKKHDLVTIGDLAELVNSGEDMIMGIDFEFYERNDGFFAMADTYGMEVKKRDVKTMEIGMTYEAISRDNIQVAMVFATDGKLDRYDLAVLEDDKNFFPAYNIAVTVRKEIYDDYPEIADILRPISTYLNDDIMRRLNYLVDAEGKEPDEVAQQFLEGLGLLD
ncbi:MAG: glycine betaine ABC transporter substrate-binding protein [Thermotogota bacterium]